jgi:hypothetical protein
MDTAAARTLAASLTRTSFFGDAIKTTVSTMDPTRIVFRGGLQGEHSLDISVSCEARVRAHFAGYCENNGLAAAPAVGEHVRFPSGSSSTGWRAGRVVKVGPKRVTIEFHYNYGRKTSKSVSISELHFGQRHLPAQLVG